MRGQIYFLSALILVVPNEILGHGEKKHISKPIHISKQINIVLPNQDPLIENEDILNDAHQTHRDLTIVTNYDKKKKSTHGNHRSKKIIKLQPHKGSHSTHVHIQSSPFGSQEPDKNIDGGDLLAKLRNDRERKKALKEQKLKAIKDGIEKNKGLRTEKLLAHKTAKKNLHNGVHTGEITIDISKQNSKFKSHGRDLSSDSRSDDFSSDSRSEDFSSDSRGGDFSDSRSEDSNSNFHSHHVKQVSQLNSKEIMINDNKKNIGTDLLTKLKNDRESKKALKAEKLKAILDDIERKKALKAEKLKAILDDIERKKALKAEKLKAIRGDITRKEIVKTDKLKALQDVKKTNSHTGLHTGDVTIDITKQNSKSDSHNGDISGSLESQEVDIIPQLNSEELKILRDHIEIINKNTNTGTDWLAKLKNEKDRKEAIKSEKLKAIRDDIERKKAIKADKLKALKEAKTNSHTGLHTGGITIDITKQNSKSDSHNGDISGSSESQEVDLIPQLNSEELEILRDHIEIINKNTNTGTDWLAKLKNERERKEAIKAEKLKAIRDDIERKKAIKADKLNALKQAKTNSHTGLHTGGITIDITKQNSKSDLHHVQVIPQLNPEGVEIVRDYNNKNKNTGSDLLAKLKNDRERKEALKAEKLKVILDDIQRKKATAADKLKTLQEAKINSQAGLHTGDLTIDISKQSDSHADLHPGGLIIDISKQSESRSDNLDRNSEKDVEFEKVSGSVKKAVNSVTHVVTGGIGTLIDATVDQLKKSKERNHNKSSQKLLNVEISKTQSDLLKDSNIPKTTIQISHSFNHDKNLGISDGYSQTDLLNHHLIPTNKKKIDISHSFTHNKNLDIGSSNQQIGILKHPVLPPNNKKIDISHSFTHDKNLDIDISNQQIGALKHHLPNTSTKMKTVDISHSFTHDKNLGIGGSKTKTISRKFHLESHKEVI